MTDQEVGDLWNTVQYWSQQPFPPPYARTYENLIRKLVEERAKVRHYVDIQFMQSVSIKFSESPKQHQERYRRKAMTDFKIDPATWPSEPTPSAP